MCDAGVAEDRGICGFEITTYDGAKDYQEWRDVIANLEKGLTREQICDLQLFIEIKAPMITQVTINNKTEESYGENGFKELGLSRHGSLTIEWEEES